MDRSQLVVSSPAEPDATLSESGPASRPTTASTNSSLAAPAPAPAPAPSVPPPSLPRTSFLVPKPAHTRLVALSAPALDSRGRSRSERDSDALDCSTGAHELLATSDAIVARLQNLAIGGGLQIEKSLESDTLSALRRANLPTTRADPDVPASSLPPTSLAPPATSGDFLRAFQEWHTWSRSYQLVTFPIVGSAVAVFLAAQPHAQRLALAELLEAYRAVTVGTFGDVTELQRVLMGEERASEWTEFVLEARKTLGQWTAVRELVGRLPLLPPNYNPSAPTTALPSPSIPPRHPSLVVRLAAPTEKRKAPTPAPAPAPKKIKSRADPVYQRMPARKLSGWTVDDAEEREFMTAAAELQGALAALYVHRGLHLSLGTHIDGVAGSAPAPAPAKVARFGQKHTPRTLPYSDYMPGCAPAALTPSLSFVPPLEIVLPGTEPPISTARPWAHPPTSEPIPSPRTLLPATSALLPILACTLSQFYTQARLLVAPPLPSLVAASHASALAAALPSQPLFGGSILPSTRPLLSSTSFVIPDLYTSPPAGPARPRARERTTSRDAIVERDASAARNRSPVPQIGGFSSRASGKGKEKDIGVGRAMQHRRVVNVGAGEMSRQASASGSGSEKDKPTPPASSPSPSIVTPPTARPLLSQSPHRPTRPLATASPLIHPLAQIYANSTPEQRQKFFGQLARQGVDLSPRATPGRMSPLILPVALSASASTEQRDKGKGKERDKDKEGETVGLGFDVEPRVESVSRATMDLDRDEGPALVAIVTPELAPKDPPLPPSAADKVFDLTSPARAQATLAREPDPPRPTASSSTVPTLTTAAKASWAPAPTRPTVIHAPTPERYAAAGAVARVPSVTSTSSLTSAISIRPPPAASSGVPKDPRVRPTKPPAAVVQREDMPPSPPIASTSALPPISHGQKGTSCAGCVQAKAKCAQERPCARCTKLGRQCEPTQRSRRLSTTGSSDSSALSFLASSHSPSPPPPPPKPRTTFFVDVPQARRGMSLAESERFGRASEPKRPFG